MRYQSVILRQRICNLFLSLGYESQNSLKKKEKDLWTAKKVSSTKHSSIIHPATIHSSIIQTSSLHPPSTHHISCTRFPSRQTALMVVSGHQTLSNLKRIKVQQLQNESSHQCWFTYFLFFFFIFISYIIKHGKNSKLCPSVPLFLL